MRFGGKEHTLSGFVRREIIMKDNKGNKQIAREEQFFNSGKNQIHFPAIRILHNKLTIP